MKLFSLTKPSQAAEALTFLYGQGFVNVYPITLLERFGINRPGLFFHCARSRNGILALTAVRDGVCHIAASGGADFKALAGFVALIPGLFQAIGGASSMAPLGGGDKKHFLIMRKAGPAAPRGDFDIVEAQGELLRGTHALLSANGFPVGSYDGYYAARFYSRREDYGRVYALISESRVCSTASVVAKGERLAMIGGVATAADCRGRGYASALVAYITKELISEGKTPCIACDNPVALSVYQGCGFEKTDYMMVRDLRRQPLPT